MQTPQLLKLALLGLFFCCCTTFVHAADQEAAEQAAPAEQAAAEEAQEKAEQKKKGPPAPVLTEKPPIYAPPKLKPRKPLAPAPEITIKKQEQPQADPDKKKQEKQANEKSAQQPLRPNLQPTGSGIQLDRINNAHLSPALLWHLRRAGVPVAPVPSATPQPTSFADGEKFYPGVSRLPEQKPFDGLQPPPTAFDRYWPLLLEARQDPNTGFIIWRLP